MELVRFERVQLSLKNFGMVFRGRLDIEFKYLSWHLQALYAFHKAVYTLVEQIFHEKEALADKFSIWQ